MAFPPPHIHPPQPTHRHTHTIILLHGRGSDGPEFASELFSCATSAADGQNLPARLPSWRWVFPTARERQYPELDEEEQEDDYVMRAWFDAYSLKMDHFCSARDHLPVAWFIYL
ncbi:hypothetical protein VTN96DRAFT_2753 [Rasamsonia emersonii]